MKEFINSQIDLYETILNCVAEKWPKMEENKKIKIVNAIYQSWSLTDINSTLEAIEMDVDRYENLCKQKR
ncbi:hypothetical protein Javan425_0050 [Streptococcus phage Javan425]|uniref:Phage protein n=1 Tax=Streptococcus porcinus str. Jelinkova 176 TaxID=873448 RepID=A0ABP2KWS5_STRPO|nr:hypothetical protein [Streptococcus porcinus]EGJ26528.1 hypothetical protein STRPO_0253 [Streptococcus porcinus str. Jelinkova 176]QBX18355.1 hypothetical protein Javan423_0009 [Streptococcus phage Javan423]QBX18455.1 hypothetical protein Javan425_0050 [Streptococcus phage Javan425]SQG43933.1 phage protein [Streptococcus porcinus]